MHGDARSRRVAIVPDSVLNEPAGDDDRLLRLAEDGWGVIALPPAGLSDALWQAWAVPIIDEVATFLADGYEVAIADWAEAETERFRSALSDAGWAIEWELS